MSTEPVPARPASPPPVPRVAPRHGPGVEVRAARLEDVDALAVLSELPLLRAYGVTREGLGRDLSGAIARGEGLVVAEREGEPIGFAWFLERGTFAMGGYLRLIAVGPDAHGQGVGSRLLEAVERQTSRASRMIFLLVSGFNDGARRFYERHGYTEGGVFPGLVKPGIDEHVYWKRLR